MSDYTFIPIIALICYLFLLFAFIAAKKNNLIKSFILILCTSVLWTGGSLFMRMQLWPSMKFWYDISILGIWLMPFSFLYFTKEFVGSKKRKSRRFWFLVVLVASLINSLTGFFLEVPKAVVQQGETLYIYDITWKVLIMFFICLLMVIQMVVLLQKCFKYDEVRKKQFRPIIIGIAVMFIGHALMLLPYFEGFPIDILSGLALVICIFFALYKRRLFKLTLLVSKGSCYIIAGILSAFLFSNFINIIDGFIRTNFFKHSDKITLIIALLFTLFTLVIYNLMKCFIDRIFIRDEILRSDILKEFSVSVSKSLKINEILEQLVDVIEKTVHAKKIYVCIEDNDTGYYKAVYSSSPLDNRNFYLDAHIPIIEYLKSNSECILLEDFKSLASYKSMWEKEKKQISDLDIECFVPLVNDNILVGVVLISGKERGSSFTYDDISFLSSVNSICSIAVKNSRLYERAYLEARTDELTGLLNRKYFFELLNEEFNKTNGHSLALIILNIDDFKLYNQLYGNKEGDLALSRVARIINATVGNNGYVARYSGKEFAVILPGYDMLSAKNLADNIRKQILNMNKSSSEYSLKVLTVSGGICAIPYGATTVKELVENADMAVFQVKRSGKNAILLSTGGGINPVNIDTVSDHKENIYSEYASTIYALTAAIDTKDHYTFNHSKNVAYYACELAYACGLSEDSVEIIREAGLLHDIGKIGIPEHILNKPGALTDEEYETMKGHVENSVSIIRHLPSLDYVIPAVIGHHERYDGRGYPRRIAGEDIPLSARILCIADSFDAMVSKRSYKKAYEVEFALQEIEKQSGRQFDYKLADIFVNLVRNGKITITNED